MITFSAPIGSPETVRRRERGWRAIFSLWALSFVLPLLVVFLPNGMLGAVASVIERFPGLQHLASLCIDPTAAAAGISVSLGLALAVFFVSLSIPYSAEMRVRALAEKKRLRPSLAMVGSIALFALVLFHVPGPPDKYSWSYSFFAFLGKSQLAVAALCLGLCVFASTCLISIRVLFDRGEK